MRTPDGLARWVEHREELEDTQRVGNFELYDFPKEALAPSMNAKRAADLLAYQTRVDETNGTFTLNEVEIANSLSALWPSDSSHRSMTLIQAFRKAARARTNEDSETWVEGEVANTLNGFDVGDTRSTHAILGGTEEPDDLLPMGLDSHRYRTCGNGVAAPVAEWIGRRIVEVNRRWAGEGTNV
jgi:site-specific DNA-cytosine methylase